MLQTYIRFICYGKVSIFYNLAHLALKSFMGSAVFMGDWRGCDKSTTVEVTVKDATKPEISTAEATSLKTIVVTFSEDVKQAETFAVTLNDEALPEGITASVEGKTLTITNTNEFASGDYKIAFTGLTDLAGNDFAEGKNTTTVSIDAESYKAEEAVNAYEAAEVTNYLSYAKAETLKGDADKAIAKVTDTDKKKTFNTRVAAKETAINDIVDPKVKAVNESVSQTALLTALNDFFDDADQDNIVTYEKLITDAGKGNRKYSADDIQNKVIYETNFMAKFDDAVKPAVSAKDTTVNEFKLLAALNYGQEKGLLTGVNEGRINAYVAAAKTFTASSHAESSSAVQSSLIDSAVNAILTTAGQAYKNAVDEPAGKSGNDSLIDLAETATLKVPSDIVIADGQETISGLKKGDNASEAYAKGIAELKRVKAVIDTLDSTAANIDQATLLKALKEQGFERIVDSYVTDYINGITNDAPDAGTGKVPTESSADNVKLTTTCANSKATAEDAVAEIQKRIDSVNDIKADLAVKKASTNSTKENVEKAKAAIALIKNDYPAETDKVARTVKADLTKVLEDATVNIDVTEALAKIDKWTATTSITTVKSDLKALGLAESNKEKPGFDIDTVDDTNDKVLAIVRTFVVANNTGDGSDTKPNTAAGVQQFVKDAAIAKIAGKEQQSAGSGVAQIDAITGWTNSGTATTTSEVKADLATLAKSVSKDTTPAFKMDIVDTTERALGQIRDNVVETSSISDKNTVAQIVGLVKTAVYKEGIQKWTNSGTPTALKDVKADLVTLQKVTSQETTDEDKFSMDIVDTTDRALTQIRDTIATTSSPTLNEVDSVSEVNTLIQKAALASVNSWASSTPAIAVDIVKADLQTVSKSLSNETTPAFTYDCVDEKYLAEIRDQVKGNNNFHTAQTAENLRKDVDAAYVAKFNALTTASAEKDITDILTTIGKMPGFDATTARTEVYSKYIAARDALKAYSEDSSRNANAVAKEVYDATELQTLVTEQNNLFDVNGAGDDNAKLKEALSAIAVMTDNVPAKKAYIDLTSEQKDEIVKLFMNDKAFDTTTNPKTAYAVARTSAYTKYDKTDSVSTDVKALIEAIYGTGASTAADDGVVTKINNACDGSRINKNGAPESVEKSISAVKTALAGLHYTKYDELTNGKKLAVAEAFLNAYPQTTDKDGQTTPVVDHFKTMDEIETVIDSLLG